MNNAIKALSFTTMDLNILLHMWYVPSQQNPADAPSRRLSSFDYTLTSEIWNEVQLRFRDEKGHSCDLMALDSNTMPDRLGCPLPHFTPYPSPCSIGVNLLAQDLTQFSAVIQHPYVFPQDVLVGQSCASFSPIDNHAQLWSWIYTRENTGGLFYNDFLERRGNWQVQVIHKPCYYPQRMVGAVKAGSQGTCGPSR